jgi:hypothetical protein
VLSRWFFVVYEPRRRNRGCAIGGLIAVIPHSPPRVVAFC